MGKLDDQVDLVKGQAPSTRVVAFFAIVFSTVAITGCLVTFPLVFHYVQTLEASVQMEVDFCKSRSRDLWKEMIDIQFPGDSDRSARLGRAAGLGRAELAIQQKLAAARAAKFQARDDAAVQGSSASAGGSCCTCHRGPPGPSGQAGRDGRDGDPGTRGTPGERGTPAEVPREPRVRFPEQCPCEAAPGDQGPNGQKGPDGPAGDNGGSGQDGKPGDQGPRGPAGQPGQAGQPGERGPAGEPGKQVPGDKGPRGPAGQPGRPGQGGQPGKPGNGGKDGQPGQPGSPGDAGQPGGPGKNGAPGAPGDAGQPGAPGSCDQCPPARLAPGY